MTKQPNWWKYARTAEPDIKLLEQLLNDDISNFYTPHQIQAIQLHYSIITSRRTVGRTK